MRLFDLSLEQYMALCIEFEAAMRAKSLGSDGSPLPVILFYLLKTVTLTLILQKIVRVPSSRRQSTCDHVASFTAETLAVSSRPRARVILSLTQASMTSNDTGTTNASSSPPRCHRLPFSSSDVSPMISDDLPGPSFSEDLTVNHAQPAHRAEPSNTFFAKLTISDLNKKLAQEKERSRFLQDKLDESIHKEGILKERVQGQLKHDAVFRKTLFIDTPLIVQR